MEYGIIAKSIVDDPGLTQFINEVNQAIRQGWEPIGGVSMVSGAAGNLGFTTVCQAMVRRFPESERRAA